MTEAKEAFNELESKIVLAKEQGHASFSSDSPYLEEIPSGISALKNLKKLDLSNTNVSDLSPIASLTQLEELVLIDLDRGLSNLSPLENMTNLKSLNLSGTDVADLSPLSRLKKLEILNLSGSNVSSIEPLRTVNSLRILNLDSTEVADIRIVLFLTKLRNSGPGFSFENSGAANSDNVLWGLSKIENSIERYAATVAYLKGQPTWPDPLPLSSYAQDNGAQDKRVTEDEKVAIKRKVIANREVLALSISGVLEQLAEYREKVRGLNHLETETRTELLDFVDQLAGKLETLLHDLPMPEEEVDDEKANRMVLWYRAFKPMAKQSVARYAAPDNVADAAVPTGIILGCTAIGALLGHQGALVGSVVGGLITGQIKPGKAADELQKLDVDDVSNG